MGQVLKPAHKSPPGLFLLYQKYNPFLIELSATKASAGAKLGTSQVFLKFFRIFLFLGKDNFRFLRR